MGFPGGSVVKKKKKKEICLPMQETSQSLEDPLEKEVATSSSVLAWDISWTEEPGRLQPIGSQKSRTRAEYHEVTLDKALAIKKHVANM